MAQQKKETLEIQDWRGINRFAKGTVTPPNEFFTMQGMHPVSRGELRTILGCEKLYDASSDPMNPTPLVLPGVEEIVHVAFLEQTFGEQRLICLYTPNIDQIPAPVLVAGQLTNLGGGNGESNVLYVTYVGPGGALNRSAILASDYFDIEDNGLRYTLPTGTDAPPDYVAEIQFHAEAATTGADSAVFLGAVQRRNGAFAASIDLPSPRLTRVLIGATDTSGTNSTPHETIATQVDKFRAIPIDAGPVGKLVGGRTYFFGITPWIFDTGYDISTHDASVLNEISYTDSALTYFVFTLPAGYNSIRIQMTGMPATVHSVTNDKFLLFMGETLEDMCAAEFVHADSTGQPTIIPSGKILPVTRTDLEAGDVVVCDLPINSSLQSITYRWNTVSGGGGDTPNYSTGDNLGAPEARDYGLFRQSLIAFELGGDYNLQEQPLCTTMKTSLYGAWVIPVINTLDSGSLAVDPTACWQLLAPVPCRHFAFPPLGKAEDASVYNNRLQPYPFTTPNTEYSAFYQQFVDPVVGVHDLHSRSYSNRLFVSNGINTPFYTNGISWKPIVRGYVDATTPAQNIPIAKYVEVAKDQLILGGGTSNKTYTANGFYHSTANDPFDFGGATAQFIGTNSGDFSDIVGFGVYSPDLSNTGPSSFLFVGKKSAVGVWSGDASTGFQLLDKVSGLAGPLAFGRTNLGSVFVGRNNVYLLQSGQQAVPFGYEIQDIIQSLTEAQLYATQATFFDNKLRIAYPDQPGDNRNREIFLELRLEKGGTQKFYSGPHLLKEFYKQDSINYTEYAPNLPGLLVASLAGQLYIKNFTKSDDGAAIARKLVISRLALQEVHFWKVMTDIYLSREIEADETFTLTLNFEDGSAAYTATVTSLLASGARKLLQHQIPMVRPRGRIVQITIENTSVNQVSFFDISLLYQALRRRLL